MTATVQARNVGAGFGDRELFSGVDLVVAPGDVIGLVGPNGAGKSTLLQILGGRRQPDAGSVSVSPAHAQLGYLAQEIERVDGASVRDHLGRRRSPSTRPPTPSVRGRTGPTTPTPTRWNAGSHSGAPTSTRAWARSPTTSGSPSTSTIR